MASLNNHWVLIQEKFNRCRLIENEVKIKLTRIQHIIALSSRQVNYSRTVFSIYQELSFHKMLPNPAKLNVFFVIILVTSPTFTAKKLGSLF